MTLEEIVKIIRDFLAGFAMKQTNPGVSVTVSKEIGSFHKEPTPPWDMDETRDMAHADPELKKRYTLLKAEFERETGHQLFETCTWRSAHRQNALYRIGRSGIKGETRVTNIDGINIRSRHNVYPSQAVDVAVDSDPGPGKVVVWDLAAYAPLGPLAIKHGLIWGGSWASFNDSPHLELPPGFEGDA